MFRNNQFVCWALLLTSGILYGSSFSWMKLAVSGGANPLGMVFWFVLIAGFVLGCKQLLFGRERIFGPGLLAFCVPWAVLSVILPNLLFFYAAGKIQAGLIAIGISLVPILTLSGAILLGRESLNLRRAIGITLGAIGVTMILLPDTSLPKAGDALYVVIAFAGACCYAAEHLFIEIRIPKEVRLESLLFLMFLSAVLILFPLVLLTDTFVVPNWPLQTTELAILTVAAVTLLDYFIITLLIVWAGPVFTSQAAYIVTLAGVAWGIVIFDDVHSPWIWAAMFVLMVGLTFVRPRFAVETP